MSRSCFGLSLAAPGLPSGPPRSSLRKSRSDARQFLARHRAELARTPVAVFAMGPQTLEAKDVAASRGQLEQALAREPDVQPVSVAIFGGVVDPAKLHFPLSRMPASDARDWD